MTESLFQWSLPSDSEPPADWQASVVAAAIAVGSPPDYAPTTAQMLWQRGFHDLASIPGFLDPDAYQPTSPSAFGNEMTAAISRLEQAYVQGEKVAIWGDFDADGLTATAVLWEGLGQFFPWESHLQYYVPNRFTESHGLSSVGLETLTAQGCSLIVTCDTGSTAHVELEIAQSLGMEVIVTDHHTLPGQRPPVVALINPRQLPSGHPLADLSGVAVAYKLVEALYERLPQVPQQPLETLLDLVAIGLIADLVSLRGDCRYLTQRGLRQLELQAKARVRPGVAKLLELCKGTGDRPSDIAFGIGPRINAVSRIHGDARFGVELLTSRDRAQAEALAWEAELANTRRKELQAAVLCQATEKLATVDLSTTQVIILSDPQWSPGVLGLVASQIAQTYFRPTILFQTETTAAPGHPLMARGSARSVNQIDLYQLVEAQAHLLKSFGGHPFAAGLSLPVDNLPLLVEGLNRAMRSQLVATELPSLPPLAIDAEVLVVDLGRDLFKALKLLEPYGMGNPVPRLLLRQVTVSNVQERALRDKRGGKQRYYKVTFNLTDASTEVLFPGHWWGHRQTDLPEGCYDLVIELDVNTFDKRYEARFIDARTVHLPALEATAAPTQIIDQRATPNPDAPPPAIAQCPTDWMDIVRYQRPDAPLLLTYALPAPIAPEQLWQQWVGIAKYLARTGASLSWAVLREKLGLSGRTLQVGGHCLQSLGGKLEYTPEGISNVHFPTDFTPEDEATAAQTFMLAVQEEQFRRHYFYSVPSQTLAQVLTATEPH
jgi:single-stranded-DNA-specific exonuclease